MTAGNRWHKVFGTVAVCVLCLALGACSFGDWFPESSGVSPKETLLDPADPVQVELWTYYTGAQQRAFEASLEEFNATRGRDVGVVAVHVSQGSISDLSAAVTDAARGLVGAHDMPDAFLSYPDTASVVDGLGGIADLSGYFSDEERDAFVDAFLAEGDLDGDGGIKLVPVGKSTETLQINMTDWQKFSEATGAGLDDLRTVEGITATAGRYYRWTDANTPDVADDGLPFFGRDALANYLLTGSRQLGHDILTVSDGKAEMTIDEETIRTLWDNYYVPLMNGYFSDEGRFRSDAVKTGELICFVGSTSSAVYFPTSVTVDDSSSYRLSSALCRLRCSRTAFPARCSRERALPLPNRMSVQSRRASNSSSGLPRRSTARPLRWLPATCPSRKMPWILTALKQRQRGLTRFRPTISPIFLQLSRPSSRAPI